MGGGLAGEPTSGSVDHFGSTGSFTLPNTGVRVSMSTKFIDTGTLLECAAGLGVEPIQPDVIVYQTLEDYLAGQDTLVDALCARTEPFQPQERPDAPLSRGRLTELLRQAAEQPLLFCKLRPPRRFPALCCRNSCQRIDQPCDIFLAVCPGNNADHVLLVGKLCTDAVFLVQTHLQIVAGNTKFSCREYKTRRIDLPYAARSFHLGPKNFDSFDLCKLLPRPLAEFQRAFHSLFSVQRHPAPRRIERCHQKVGR